MTKHDPCRRSLLIALTAAPIHRVALCRLGSEIDCWAEVRGTPAARDIAARIGLPYGQLRRALDLRRHADTIAGEECRRAEVAGGRVISRRDSDYPAAFTDLALPPPALYLRGEPRDLVRQPAIAMVGARRMDAYGRACAQRFARHLAAAGVTIVSGFALGIDQTAHRGALDAAGGRTVAVLGCGIDIDYPSATRPLAARIAASGALVSELPMGSPPRPFHFPLRNRLIAALGLGVLVVQAKARSGSLITAHHALELGRDIWAIPGPIDRALAAGPNDLIADGACLVTAPEDILTALPLAAQETLFPSKKLAVPRRALAPGLAEPQKVDPPPSGLPGQVLGALSPGEPRSAEALAKDTALSVDRVLGALLELELAGRVQRLPGPVYERAGTC